MSEHSDKAPAGANHSTILLEAATIPDARHFLLFRDEMLLLFPDNHVNTSLFVSSVNSKY